ncbi:MAG: shufflon system plasmid conjugative transfer pilus tip adhesin PilV [Desulfovibrio sp.]|nr:shufflon system plasmid conjugative transfer pilus tip adhesin PilV [Desulfovibrio sp.]
MIVHLFEALLSFGLCLVLLQGLMPVWEHWRESGLEQRLAGDMSRVASAAQAYAQANLTELFSQAKENTGPCLSSANGMPEIFSPYLLHAHSGRNELGWHYELHLRKVPLGSDHALVLVLLCQAERPVSAKILRSAARALARQCRSLPVERYHELCGYLDDQGELVAATTRLDLGIYGITARPGSLGYVATLLGAEAWARVYGHDQLYRLAIPGMPELNRMAADLDLDRHRLTNVAALGLRARDNEEQAEALAGQVFLRQAASGETLGLYYHKERAGELVQRKLLDSDGPSVQGIYLLGHGARLEKPACEGARAALVLSPLGQAGSDRARQAYYDEDELAWTIRLREESDTGLWQDALAARVQAVTYCLP